MTEIPEAPFYCPVCHRTDGKHELTAKERKTLRQIGRRAFWNGFLGFFWPRLLEGRHIFQSRFQRKERKKQ